MTKQSTPLVFVLIVDDLPENLTALDALLRRPGLNILQARSGQDALELLLLHEVALAIVDVQMPGMSGFELAELMRGAERTRRVPIIFVTAGVADRQRRFRGYEAGAVDFLNKPIEPDILRSKADVFFELFKQRQEVAQQRDELKAAAEKIQCLLQASEEQAEALRDADHRKDDFLATLAHELRNPLAPIRNAIEILKIKSRENDDLKGPLEIATRQVGHMARLIDDLLDVARIVKGKVELRLERCDFIKIVRQTADDYRPTLESSGITLMVKLEPKEFFVLGDATRLAQMIGNILHNAGKFTPSGGSIQVCAQCETGPHHCTISIADTGRGFELADSSSLFEPFSQSSEANSNRKGGLGLGLALTKGLIELHGGNVTADSPGVGKGAKFTLSIPVAKQTNPEQEELPQTPVESTEPLSIVVIEDNVDAAKSLQLLLSLQGHQVHVAADGTSGVEAVKVKRPDVVISDLGLPGHIDGYRVAQILRDDSSLTELYLVALSGYGQENDRIRTRDAGFNEHLIKPVELESLKRLLGTVPRKKR